ncbi:MAG TPA: hypothetical protein VMH91_03900, partial [Candidatus Paceibacterota bacterium]|nr:hypothetical protein [Candidatus Paceibacterota bacterium]
ADVKELARRAAEIKRTGNALTEAQAIGKAIRGKGITHRADVERLMRQVGIQYARDKRDAERTARRKP